MGCLRTFDEDKSGLDPVADFSAASQLAFNEWFRSPTTFEADVKEKTMNAAWLRIEEHIADRFSQRPFTAVFELTNGEGPIQIPRNGIVTVTQAQIFDAEAGSFQADSFALTGIPGELTLPRAGVWQITGTLGPSPTAALPDDVKAAWRVLSLAYYENRGDVADPFARHGIFIGSGCADLLRARTRYL